MLAEPFTGDDPFVVVFPDDLHVGEPPLTRQLIDTYERTGCSVLAVEHDPPHLERYGVVALAADGLHITGIVEKPPPGTEPSRDISIGRYLCLHHRGARIGPGGEHQRRHREVAVTLGDVGTGAQEHTNHLGVVWRGGVRPSTDSRYPLTRLS